MVIIFCNQLLPPRFRRLDIAISEANAASAESSSEERPASEPSSERDLRDLAVYKVSDKDTVSFPKPALVSKASCRSRLHRLNFVPKQSRQARIVLLVLRDLAVYKVSDKDTVSFPKPALVKNIDMKITKSPTISTYTLCNNTGEVGRRTDESN